MRAAHYVKDAAVVGADWVFEGREGNGTAVERKPLEGSFIPILGFGSTPLRRPLRLRNEHPILTMLLLPHFPPPSPLPFLLPPPPPKPSYKELLAVTVAPLPLKGR